MNTQRLERLVSILEGIKQDRRPFSLWGWADSTKNMIHVVGLKTHPEACGTACCAAGYAALDPEFRKEGFTLKVDLEPHCPAGLSSDEIDRFYDDPANVGRTIEVANVVEFNKAITDPNPNLSFVSAYPTFQGLESTDACAAFFDISSADAWFLFTPDAYSKNKITPADVIKRVQEVLKRGSVWDIEASEAA